MLNRSHHVARADQADRAESDPTLGAVPGNELATRNEALRTATTGIRHSRDVRQGKDCLYSPERLQREYDADTGYGVLSDALVLQVPTLHDRRQVEAFELGIFG